MRLYHDRSEAVEGRIDRRDEEDCYRASGRKRGVFLTAERIQGERVICADIPVGDVTEFEVTDPGDAHRTFVVPHTVLETFAFEATAVS